MQQHAQGVQDVSIPGVGRQIQFLAGGLGAIEVPDGAALEGEDITVTAS